jgi:hypothetical protein
MGNLIAPTRTSDPRDVALAVVLIRAHYRAVEGMQAQQPVPWRANVHRFVGVLPYPATYTVILRRVLNNAPNRAELEEQGLYEMLQAISDRTVMRWGMYYYNDASSMFENNTTVNCQVCNDLLTARPDSWHYEGATGEYTFEELMEGPLGREFWRRPADRYNDGAGPSSLPPMGFQFGDAGTSLFGNRRFYN